jgi:hypothetical protein
MSTFTGKLDYTPLDNGMYRINKPVRFYLSDTLSGNYVEIYEGIVVNFASIPKALQFLFPHDHEDYKVAAAFHDPMVNEHGQQIYLCRNEIRLREPTWDESAFWFREMMRVRQWNTRRKLPYAFRLPVLCLDFFTRWSFWAAIMFHGLTR